jgi:hypothetical protein
MQDLSFLRLEPTLKQGLYTRPSSVTSIFYLSQIQLSPNEFYCQITNTKDGISFDGNYTVFVTDCNGIELLEITEKVKITEFTYNGLPQIKFEIAPILQDLYKKNVLLKFNHTVSDYVWFSNPIVISEYEINQTTRFNYRNYTGAEATANVMQSIRLNCWFDVNDSEGDIKEYTQINGNIVSGRTVLTEFEKYKFERIDNFTFRRLNNLLTSSVIYVNGNRCTNKQVLSSSERVGSTNVWSQEITIPINYNDTFNDIPQVWESFTEINFSPVNINSTATSLFVQYNREITTSATAEIRLYKNGVLFFTFNSFINGSQTRICTFDALTVGSYRVEVDAGSFISVLGETLPLFFWDFEIISGEFDSSDFNAEFLIN